MKGPLFLPNEFGIRYCLFFGRLKICIINSTWFHRVFKECGRLSLTHPLTHSAEASKLMPHPLNQHRESIVTFFSVEGKKIIKLDLVHHMPHPKTHVYLLFVPFRHWPFCRSVFLSPTVFQFQNSIKLT